MTVDRLFLSTLMHASSMCQFSGSCSIQTKFVSFDDHHQFCHRRYEIFSADGVKTLTQFKPHMTLHSGPSLIKNSVFVFGLNLSLNTKCWTVTSHLIFNNAK